MTVSLNSLGEDDLVQILQEPKNALVKQYKKIFKYDDVELEFTDDATIEIAKEAIKRKTGARGLRSVIEESMLDLMYEIPSRDDVKKVTITGAFIRNEGAAIMELEDGTEVSYDEKVA